MKSAKLPDTEPADVDDPRLLEAAREYLAELESGGSLHKEQFADRYPDLDRSLLLECLDGVELACALQVKRQRHDAEVTAQPLGDFRIVREIGRGGMGVVYEAVQLSLGRRVALKVLPFAAALDSRQLQRFQLEAQAAAQLHHPNIVPIYFVGVERGTHFYAMQLIEGQPISSVLLQDDQQRVGVAENAFAKSTIQGSTRQTSTLRASIERSAFEGQRRDRFHVIAKIVAQVANALDYAHNCGIVHRDIKPANLLLDTSGKVWITDFGLAQMASGSVLTQTGDLLGTLRYMSPEQAAGQRGLIDPRTDIYSLGATMYELLSHHPLVEGQDRQELLHRILTQEPQGVRRWDRAIPVELETIVLKATSTAVQDRYATAGEMADDLQRFLDQRPIRARRPTLLDRGRKWLRRHPAIVVTVFTCLIIGMFGLSIAVAMIHQEKTLTNRALQREQERAEEAKRRLELAQRAADELIEIAEDELADNPMESGLRQRLLESSLAYYQELMVENREDLVERAEMTQTSERVRRILADLAVLQTDRDTMLLREPIVLQDLGLNEEQRQRIQQVVVRHQQQRGPFSETIFPVPSGPPSYQRILDAAHQNDRELAAILSPSQRGRLRQIALQWMGPRAFFEADVDRQLALTGEQKRAIREHMRTMAPFGRGGRQRHGGGPPLGGLPRFGPPNFGPEHPSSQGEFGAHGEMEQLLQLLTLEQTQRWRELVGPAVGMEIR